MTHKYMVVNNGITIGVFDDIHEIEVMNSGALVLHKLIDPEDVEDFPPTFAFRVFAQHQWTEVSHLGFMSDVESEE